MTAVSPAHVEVTLDRLAIKVGLTQRFNRSVLAVAVWRQEMRRIGRSITFEDPIPETAVRLIERCGQPVGLVIQGRWERASQDWDLSWPFSVFLADGSLVQVESVFAERVEEL